MPNRGSPIGTARRPVLSGLDGRRAANVLALMLLLGRNYRHSSAAGRPEQNTVAGILKTGSNRSSQIVIGHQFTVGSV